MNLAPAPPVVASHSPVPALIVWGILLTPPPQKKKSLSLFGGESISYPRIHIHLRISSINIYNRNNIG